MAGMVHVSCVQLYPKLGDVDANIQKMVSYLETIMKERPETDLIVYPELCNSGYECTTEQFQELAETVPKGKTMKVFSELCKKYGVTVVYGYPERDPVLTDVLYNSAICINEKGEVLGSYRKTHPFASEIMWCRPGHDFPLIETSFGKIGIMICWDTAFPEVARSYALQGAELLVVSTNWEKPYEEDWDLITSARAFDNTLHLVAANRIGDDKELGFFGRSKIIDPIGKVIQALDREEEGIIYATLDLSLTEKKRAEYYTFFKDRQPHIYTDITKEYR